MVEFITPESCVKIRVGFKNPTEHTENYNYTEYKENIERKVNDTVEPSKLIFDSNNYNTPQTVTINSSKDNNEIEDTSVIKINSSNISEKQLIVTITDK